MDDKVGILKRYIKLLHSKISRLNLYICFGCIENEPDDIRLEEEIKRIKRIVSEIETYMGHHSN